MEKLNVTKEVLSFCRFINCSWDIVKGEFGENNDLLSDWLQGNWELLVETAIFSRLKEYFFLEIYGEGADLYRDSSRVTFPEKSPNAEVLIKLRDKVTDYLSEDKIESDMLLPWDELVAMNSNFYERGVPFEYVLFSLQGVDSVVSVKDVDFFLVKKDKV